MSAPVKTHAEQQLAEIFAQSLPALPGEAVLPLREEARDIFLAHGLPNRRVEDWKYSDLRALQTEALPLAKKPDAATLAAAGKALGPAVPGVIRLVLVDGYYAPELGEAKTLPKSVRASSIAHELDENNESVIERLADMSAASDNAAVNLNTGLFADGLVIAVAPGARLNEALHIVSYASPGAPKAVFSRSLLRMGEGSSLLLVERMIGTSTDQLNTVLEAEINAKAQFSHIRRIESEGPAQILATLNATLSEQSRLYSFAFAGSETAVLRQQMFVHFTGDHASAHVGGLSLLKGRQHADTTLFVHHDALSCESRETFQHVLANESHGVFQGKITVDAEAQKTDGRMMSRTIMLDDGPAMDNKPELEIFADDVQCAHGCTCGQLDDELLFYLQSRGLPLAEAQALMVQAFAGQALDSIPEGAFGSDDLALREAFSQDVALWVAKRSAA